MSASYLDILDGLNPAEVKEAKEFLEKELANTNSIETKSATRPQLEINYSNKDFLDSNEDFLNFNLDDLPSDFDEDNTDKNM